MNSSLRIIFALALPLSAAGAFIACGGDEGGDDDTMTPPGGEPVGGGGGELKIAFNPMYSAFEETHTYQVPAVVEGLPPNVEWTASPADAVKIEKSGEGAALFTMLKSGEVTITAKADGKSGTAKLTITPATPQEWELGSKRYNSMQSAITRTDGGMFGFGLDPNASCTNCHGEGSALMVEHTPQQTAGYSADELIKVFTEAVKPEGTGQRTNIPEQAWKAFHKWKMSEEEQKAIIVYLRSLTPKPTNAEIDFGGAVRRLLGDAGIRFPGRGDGGRPIITPRSDAGAADAGGGGSTTPVTGGIDAGT